MRTSTTVRRRRGAVAPLMLGGLLVLGGCASQAPADDASDDKDARSGETATPSEPEAEPTEEAVADSAGAQCLDGTWTVDIAQGVDAILAAAGLSPADTEVSVTGEHTVVFDGAVMTSSYRQLATSLSMSADGTTAVFSTLLDGTTTAAYTATATELVVTGVDASGMTTSSSGTVNGVPTEVPEQTDLELMGMQAESVSTYTCDATTLTIVPEGGAEVDFQQVLTRS